MSGNVNDLNLPEILAQAKNGDRAAFDELAKDVLEWLAHLAEYHLSVELRSIVQRSHIANDVLTKAWESIHQCTAADCEQFRHWLRRILANHVIDIYRSHWREMALKHPFSQEESAVRDGAGAQGRFPSPSHDLKVRDEAAFILSHVNEHERQILLDDLSGIPYAVIAEKYKFASPNAAAVSICRLKSRLRAMFGNKKQ